jgi:hypothetical protein
MVTLNKLVMKMKMDIINIAKVEIGFIADLSYVIMMSQ